MLKFFNIILYMVFGSIAFTIEPIWKGFALLGLLMVAQFLIGYSIALDVRSSLIGKKK